MCDTCKNKSCNCDKLYSSGVTFDGLKFVCNEGAINRFTIRPCDNLNTVLATFAEEICELWNSSLANNYIETVALNGNNLDFTGIGDAFNGSVDLSAYVNEIDYVNAVSLNGSSLDFTGVGNGFTGSVDLSSLTGIFLTTADNGLTANTSTNVQLGGTLIKNTTITNSYNPGLGSPSFNITGARNSFLGSILKITNTSTSFGSVALWVQNNEGYGLHITSNKNSAILVKSRDFHAAEFENRNIDKEVLVITNYRNESSIADGITIRTSTDQNTENTGSSNLITPIVGIGTQYRYQITTQDNIGGSFKMSYSNELVSKLTNVNTETMTSDWTVRGVNNGVTTMKDLLTVKGSGQLVAHEYGSGTFTGTLAKTLGVDSSGNIIEF